MKQEDLSKEQEEKINEKFQSFSHKYSENDADKVFENEDKIKSKAKHGALKQFAEDVTLFFAMLKDSFSGKYHLPFGTITSVIGTLLYIFSPIDIIPDVIPGIGLVDDAAVMTLCLNFIKNDIDGYKAFVKK